MHIAATEKRFIVRADEKLTAFVELERVTRESAASRMPNNSALISPILTNPGPLEEAEQFEHDHDYDDNSNYIKNVSIHGGD